MHILFAQNQLGWDELIRQVPLLGVAMLIGWYAFRHISKMQEDQLSNLREQNKMMLETLREAHNRVEATRDAQLKELQANLQIVRDEKDRLLKVIENIGAKP